MLPARPDDTLPELSWSLLEGSYPRYPNFGDIEGEIRAEDLHCLMDIAAYVQIGPHSINGKLREWGPRPAVVVVVSNLSFCANEEGMYVC